MKIIQTGRSMQTFFNEIIYTEAALSASPYTESLAELSRELGEEWFEIAKKERFGRQDVIRASAKLRVKANEMHMLMREFCGVLLVEVNQDRESTLYRRFFSISASKIAALPIAKQIGIVENLFIPSIEALEGDSPLKAYKERFSNSLKQTAVALDCVNGARAAKKRSSLDVEDWKDKVNTMRLTIYGELLKIASEQSLGRSWAENFFNTSGGGKKNEYEEVDETEETQELAPPVDGDGSGEEQVAA